MTYQTKYHDTFIIEVKKNVVFEIGWSRYEP